MARPGTKRNSMKNRKIIAITGGIGSGKSCALQFLKEQGFSTLSCDDVCRDLYKKRKVKKHIRQMFPTAVDGKLFLTINRKALAELIFEDSDNYNKLYSYTTPEILKLTLKKARKQKSDTFVEVPLLFECLATAHFDGVIVVLRDKDKRINAVIERSNLSKEQVEKRMARQIDYDDYDFSNYTTVTNNGDVHDLFESVLRAVNQIINK